jgi:drug/metabolite transporter (DMT)-like permease
VDNGTRTHDDRILNPLLYYLILFEAYDLLPAQEAQALNYTWAVTLSLLSVPFLGQKLSLQELGAIILAYLGVLFIATHGNLLALEFSNTQGVLLALGSTLIWSFYWLANTRSRTDPVLVLFLNFAFALPLVVLVAYFSGHLAWPSISGLAGAIYVGMFEMGIAFVTWLHAMKLTTSTARLATLIYISPFISLVLIQQLVGEDIHWSSIAGLSLIVTGSLLQQLLHRKPT